MLNILLIEDQIPKKAQIVCHLESLLGDNFYKIVYATDAITAKRHLSKEYFDLVILDLHLPKRDNSIAESHTGIEILQFIETNSKAIAPKTIISLSAYSFDDGFKQQFPFCHFINYSETDVTWKGYLTKITDYVINYHRPPYRKDKFNYHSDIAIITAISEEFDAVKQYLDIDNSWVDIKLDGDSQKISSAFKTINGKKLNIILTQASQMGLTSAAVAANKIIEAFVPRLVIMSGICAGVKDKTNFGDIIIADPCFDSGSGKWKVVEDNLIFHPAPYQIRIEDDISQICNEIRTDSTILSKIYAGFNVVGVTRPTNLPQVIIDANASGGSVLQSSVKMGDIINTHKNLVGLEMEAYAVYIAASHAKQPKPKFFSAKSVCDFGTEEKGDQIHKYAAYTSVQFINFFLNKADFLFELE
ncbi:phosphorylase [Acinetobacter baumannii]|uniref:phosphorylase family protein n=1 Tax=Acinetobacter baumannii TaxID=470 RepID=UPI002448221D|nr:phosphorylase [Acinetobacter baumannii]MDH2621148.1 phosphorylase [Acinetobacter baumannii]